MLPHINANAGPLTEHIFSLTLATVLLMLAAVLSWFASARNVCTLVVHLVLKQHLKRPTSTLSVVIGHIEPAHANAIDCVVAECGPLCMRARIRMLDDRLQMGIITFSVRWSQCYDRSLVQGRWMNSSLPNPCVKDGGKRPVRSSKRAATQVVSIIVRHFYFVSPCFVVWHRISTDTTRFFRSLYMIYGLEDEWMCIERYP